MGLVLTATQEAAAAESAQGAESKGGSGIIAHGGFRQLDLPLKKED